MLLRSSSTPVLGSLVPSSFSDSPNNSNINHHTPNSTHPIIPCNNNTTFCHHSFRKSISHSPSPLPEPKTSAAAFRRVQSEGNLDELSNADDFTLVPKKNPRRTGCSALEAIPSFSFRDSGTCYDDSDDEEDDEEEEEEDNVYYSTRIENSVSEHARTNDNVVNGYGGLGFGDEGKMYLATGLGVKFVNDVAAGGGGGGGGCGYRAVDFDRDGGDIGMEDYYKRMMEENPGNALFMSNYAQFLYQKKRDLEGAEEYYSRAILADPNDGETLSQYAKLIWELHRDKERAANYFDRAVQASSEDSHVHAAYASFLWDTEDDEDEEKKSENFVVGRKLFHHGFMASATA